MLYMLYHLIVNAVIIKNIWLIIWQFYGC